MIRTLWFYVVLVVSSVIHSIGVIGASLLGVKRRPGGGGVYDWGTNDWSRQILRAANTPVRVEGMERIPDGPVVYASNHSSMFDIWALAATLPGSVRMLAKQELASIPLLGRAMVTAGHVMIDRPHPRRALEAYERAAEVIRSGVSALVFPEGTRSRTGQLLPFKNAPFGLAIAAQVPVVPLYVRNTFEIMPKGRFFLRPRPIRIVIGDPIATAGMTLERRQELRDRVHAAVVALKTRVDAEGAAR
jgi:1-acyl-sn-glycerol-3-phosphate acyltransferase